MYRSVMQHKRRALLRCVPVARYRVHVMRWQPAVPRQAQLFGILRMVCHSRCGELQPTCPEILGQTCSKALACALWHLAYSIHP